MHKLGKRYKNIYFDLDRTLWDYEVNSERTLNDLIGRYVPELKSRATEFLKVFYKINDELWRQYRDGELKKEVLRTKRFSDTLKQLGVSGNGLAEIIGEKYIEESPYKTALFPNAIEVLEYLKNKGYRLFLLTNGFLEVQVIKIRESKLEPLFDKMITSEDVGYQKPNPKIFEFALKTANSKKTESLMVGDDAVNDIMGAQRFGMDTVFFNPLKALSEIEPTFEISNLNELRVFL